jgi:hypothetical protein
VQPADAGAHDQHDALFFDRAAGLFFGLAYHRGESRRRALCH